MKQAVVVIHGMGEQIPMGTLRGFVDTVWVHDKTLVPEDRPDANTGEKRTVNAVWSKPDKRNRSYELHRMTTEKDAAGGRTDFYEFYWAHLVHGTTFDQVKSWISDLLLRNPRKRVPKRVLNVWIALWIITLALLAIIIFAALPSTGLLPVAEERSIWTNVFLIIAGLAVSTFVAWFTNTVIVKVFGDVVRYTSAKPSNIARRQEIRENGVKLLETLMGIDLQDGEKKPYDRIIVVAHSLGTIVAYDILTHTFARHHRKLVNGKGNLQHNLTTLEGMLNEAIQVDEKGNLAEFDVEKFQTAQDAAREEINQFGNPWIVSDFITLGSPLSHADFLIAYDENELHQLQDIRQFPTCPPTMEYNRGQKEWRISYPNPEDKTRRKGAAKTRLPHHGSMFAFTKWSNIYSPRHNLVFGDVVSGPVGPQFGLNFTDKDGKKHKISGISDLPVLPERELQDGQMKPKAGYSVPFMTHTRYWDMNANTGAPNPTIKKVPHHIQTLRDSLNLLRKTSPKSE